MAFDNPKLGKGNVPGRPLKTRLPIRTSRRDVPGFPAVVERITHGSVIINYRYLASVRLAHFRSLEIRPGERSKLCPSKQEIQWHRIFTFALIQIKRSAPSGLSPNRGKRLSFALRGRSSRRGGVGNTGWSPDARRSCARYGVEGPSAL